MSGTHELSSSARGYDHAWRVARAEKLKRDPYCEFSVGGKKCGKKATTVDHRNPNGSNAMSNLRSACQSCNSREAARRGGLGTRVGAGRANKRDARLYPSERRKR